MFHLDSVRSDVCKLILETFNHHHPEKTGDPIIVDSLMFIAKSLHDSIK